MNVMRTDFNLKNKGVSARKPGNPINYLSGCQTVSNAFGTGFLRLAQLDNVPGRNALSFLNQTTSSQETDNFSKPSTSTSKESEEEGLDLSPRDANSKFDDNRMYQAREMFQRSPVTDSDSAKVVYGGETNTSSEFERLMQPFHTVLQLNSSQDEENDDFDNNDDDDKESVFLENKSDNLDESVFKKPAPVDFLRTNSTTDSSKEILNILQETTSSSRNNSKQYNIFDLHVPKAQKKNVRSLLDPELHNKRFTPNTTDTTETPVNTTTSHSSNRGSSTSSSARSSSTSDARTPKSKTGKSPKTPGSGRGNTDSETGSFILAITEGRGLARGEVGIAAMDPKRPHIILSQISDNQRYLHSLTKMNVFDFVEVIVPNTFVESSTLSKLYTDIRARFPTITLTSVQRRHFSETVGIDLIKQYCTSESASVMVLLRDKFYALSAAAALIKYVEFTQNVRLAPKSVKVEYQGTEDTMIIDIDTANRLELVMSVSHPETNLNNSLLGVVRHCHTKGGVRLLRANILQPPCSLSKIESRLDCVNELVDNPLLFYALEAAVMSFANVENLLSLCMHAPQQDGTKVAEYQLKYTLLLKTMLELLPVLSNALVEAKTDYFCEVRENLSDVRYQRILDRILQTVFENAKTVKGSVAAHLHGCFAVKPGINALLDITKKTYCEIVQEISDYIDKLKETYNLPLKMSFSVSKGFHIQLTLAPGERNMKVTDLPKEFILVQKSRATFSFYTTELVAMDQRSQQVLIEIQSLTNIILCELLNDIRKDIGCLFNLCEYIAELDVVCSFAHVGSGSNYIRPKFRDELNLKDSRHPILNVIYDGAVVPNNVVADNAKNFIILTGPNQSGKSIYIRQIALLQIMAQIGCYVPAAEATFRITDRIFSRIGFDDSIESNASTLIVEMRDIEFMRQNITPKSLVIIDELCRGTSFEEGTTLAFAICEELLDSSAFIFFTTHYLFLTKLEEMYYNVINYNFETKIETTKTGKPMLQFTHKMMPGVTKAEQYGLQVAELTSFPSDVLVKAKEISKELLKERKPCPKVNGLVSRYELSLQMRNELSAFEPDKIVWEEMEPIIRRYKNLYLNLTNLNDVDEENDEIFQTQPEVDYKENQDSQETCVFDLARVENNEKLIQDDPENQSEGVRESPSENYEDFLRGINQNLIDNKENRFPKFDSVSQPLGDRSEEEVGDDEERKMDSTSLTEKIKKKTLKRLPEKRNNFNEGKKRLKRIGDASKTLCGGEINDWNQKEEGEKDEKKFEFTSPVITNRRHIKKNLNGNNSNFIPLER